MATEKESNQEKKIPVTLEAVQKPNTSDKPEIVKEDGSVIDKFEQLPPELRKQFSETISMFMSNGPMPHPIFSKMNTEQVGEFIKNMDNDSARDHKNRMSSRRYNFAAFVLIIVFISLIFVCCVWKDKWEYILPIITAIAGFGGGYGVGTIRYKFEN